LYAKWLYKAIIKLKWHPFLRVNVQGSFRPEGQFHWQLFTGLGHSQKITSICLP